MASADSADSFMIRPRGHSEFPALGGGQKGNVKENGFARLTLGQQHPDAIFPLDTNHSASTTSQ